MVHQTMEILKWQILNWSETGVNQHQLQRTVTVNDD